VGKADAEFVEPVRRQVAFLRGKWRVTYRSSDEPGRETDVRRGLIVGPLVSDRSASLWVAVVADGSSRHTMIRRETITDIAPPHPGR
jgi:hypothetical protein